MGRSSLSIFLLLWWPRFHESDKWAFLTGSRVGKSAQRWVSSSCIGLAMGDRGMSRCEFAGRMGYPEQVII